MKAYKKLGDYHLAGKYIELTVWPLKWGLYMRRRYGEWFVCLGPLLLKVSEFPF